ncbi:MAG: hypothetical protein E6Q97_29960 [Desulfurellales bacterium]|nr:MAG: hypothetical protein E6Q97_29960 [Desulfurellales bacterium]
MNELFKPAKTITIGERGRVRTVPMPGPPPNLDEPQLPEMYTAQALTAQNLITESTSGVDRAQATLLRTVPLTVILGILGVTLMLAFSVELAWSLLLFATLTIAGYWVFTWLDYRHSASGLERHRVNTASKLKMMELRHAQELKRMALQTYLYILERNNHVDH